MQEVFHETYETDETYIGRTGLIRSIKYLLLQNLTDSRHRRTTSRR